LGRSAIELKDMLGFSVSRVVDAGVKICYRIERVITIEYEIPPQYEDLL